jgi:di/tricarboxylate transporter
VSSSLPLLFGDSLLVQGPLESMPVLAKDPDFLLLSDHRRAPQLSLRSVFSIVALLLLIFVPMLGAVPVHQVAFFSACIVIFSGAVTMEQVYREIDWRVVFLLALLIPLGHVVERVAGSEGLVALLHHLDALLPTAALAALFLLMSSALGQILDSAIAVIFLGPFALALGARSPASAQLLLLAVTLGSSFSFVLSTSCRSNVLVTGAGGYRAADFIRIGVPFTLVVGAVVVAVLSLRFLG